MKTWEKASGKKKEFATANWGRRREENGWILAPFSPEEMAPIQTGNNAQPPGDSVPSRLRLGVGLKISLTIK